MFQIRGQPQMKWGTLCLVPADNLASNILGGFKEGSTAHRGCRHCLALPSDIQSIFTESKHTLRNPDEHKASCDELEKATTQRDRDKQSMEFGINQRSILDELQHFKVCSGALVQDVMHDVLQGTKAYLLIHLLKSSIGILEHEAKELLQQHIDKDGYYSLEYLNQQITGFELGFMEMKNRPSTIALSTLRSNDHKLKQEGNKGFNIQFVF